MHRWLAARSCTEISGLSLWHVFRMSAACLAVKSSAAESRPLSPTTVGQASKIRRLLHNHNLPLGFPENAVSLMIHVSLLYPVTLDRTMNGLIHPVHRSIDCSPTRAVRWTDFPPWPRRNENYCSDIAICCKMWTNGSHSLSSL